MLSFSPPGLFGFFHNTSKIIEPLIERPSTAKLRFAGLVDKDYLALREVPDTENEATRGIRARPVY